MTTQVVLIAVIIGLVLVVGGLLIVNSRLRMKDDFKRRYGIIDDEEDEITHESFFGENIKRVIKVFKSSFKF